MTFSKDQTQALIAEIDNVLQKPTPRLPWVSGEVTQQRRVLERVRNYLVALQKQLPAAQNRSLSRTDLLSYDISYQPDPSLSGVQGGQPASAQQMLQSVMQEMNQLRSTLLQPLQADLNALQQQRESLRQEIQQLEQRRSYGSGSQPVTQEFLQVLMSRLQDLPAQAAQPERSLQPQSDQTILNLDATLRAVFEALQRDMKAYQESMAQGLDRMHSLGQQSEMMFNALITHLAQQLGREASSYLQASGQIPAPPPAPTVPAAPSYASLPAKPPAPPPSLVPQANLTAAPSPSPVDQAIDSWLQSISASTSGSTSPTAEPSSYPAVDAQEVSALPTAPEPTAAPDTIAAIPPTSTARPIDETPTDIDAALRLLQQLSTKLESPSAPSTPAAIDPLTEDGLDEFYELFGGDVVAMGGTATTSVTGQSSGSAGLEASGSFDPTHGWDVLEEQPAPNPPVLPEIFSTPEATLETTEAISETTSEAIDPTNQIGSLEDLFGEDMFEEDLPAAPETEPDPTPPDTESTESDLGQNDRYVAAAPEENLLPTPDRNAPHQEFWLDDLTLSHLSEDLSSLESGQEPAALEQTVPEQTAPEPAAPQAYPSADLHSFDMTFADLTPDPGGNEAPPQQARSPVEPNPEPASGAGVARVETINSVGAAPSSHSADPNLTQSFAFTLDDQTAGDRGAAINSVGAAPSSHSADPNLTQSFAFTLDDQEDLDELFEEPRLAPEAASGATSPTAPTAPAILSPQPTTPSPSPTPISTAASPPPQSSPASVSESFAFTLEGMDDLFAEGTAPVTIAVPPPDSAPPTLDEPLGFTLEGIDDLFADSPSAEPIDPPTPNPPTTPSQEKPGAS